jgi:hypothetical protein
MPHRSVANWPAGVPSDHAEGCLGPVIGGVRGVYDRHEFSRENWMEKPPRESLSDEMAAVTLENSAGYKPSVEAQSGEFVSSN